MDTELIEKLQEALLDGQTVRLDRHYDCSNEFECAIEGDCCINARNLSLKAAIETAVNAYSKWKKVEFE